MKRIESIAVLIWACILAVTVQAGAIAAENSPRFEVSVHQGRVSVTADNAEIAAILTEIARQAKLKLDIDRRLRGKTSIRLENVPVEEALKALTASHALVYEYDRQADVYRIIQIAAVARGTQSRPRPGQDASLQHPDKTSTVAANITQGSRRSTSQIQSGYQVPSENIDARGRKLYRPGELLVRFHSGVSAEAAAQLHLALGSRVLRRNDRLGIERIRIRAGLSEADAMKAYAAYDSVDHVELNALRYLMEVPNDPLYDELWGLRRISAEQAWELTPDAAAVVVAVIDSGIEYYHPDLAANMWQNTQEVSNNGVDDDNNGFVDDFYGFDFADNDADPLDGSISGHGTHVAGTIAAVGNNMLGITGVVWTARIMALKVQADGNDFLDTDSIVAALDYAAANGARVINCSYGGSLYSPIEYNQLKALGNQGILAVCAAGNSGVDIDLPANTSYPASYDLANIISVAASTTSDDLAEFSNWGRNSVDLAAPGVGIKSTVPGGGTEAYVQAGDTRFLALGMAFAGLTDTGGISALLIDCGQGYADEFPAAVAGNIALVKRGSRDGIRFFFSDKVANAQAKGAVAVIIFNNVVDTFDISGGTLQLPDNWLPTVSVTLADGLDLLSRVEELVTLVNHSLGDSDTYGDRQGTSMAAPFVTGAVALGRALKPNVDSAQLKSKLLESADPLPAFTDRTLAGGRLNLYAMVRSLVGNPGDLNCDSAVNLADAIVAMQVLAGADSNLCREARIVHDVNRNQRIGFEELIYLLQKIAGQRSDP